MLIGALPTIMGAESTFTFQNMNIERGLLWNQENAVNRGIQVNQAFGKVTGSLSWNDGYYSNRYFWLSGALTYVSGPHSIVFSGMGNLGQTPPQTPAHARQKQRHDVRGHLHVLQRELDRPAIFSVLGCSNQPEGRCREGRIHSWSHALLTKY